MNTLGFGGDYKSFDIQQLGIDLEVSRMKRVSERIASRTLEMVMEGIDDSPVLPVKGGRFGLKQTSHELEIYRKVAALLAYDEIDFQVYRVPSVDKYGTPIDFIEIHSVEDEPISTEMPRRPDLAEQFFPPTPEL